MIQHGRKCSGLLGWAGVVVSKLGWPRESQLRKAMFQGKPEGGGATQACAGAQSRPSPSHICKSLLPLLLLSHL